MDSRDTFFETKLKKQLDDLAELLEKVRFGLSQNDLSLMLICMGVVSDEAGRMVFDIQRERGAEMLNVETPALDYLETNQLSSLSVFLENKICH